MKQHTNQTSHSSSSPEFRAMNIETPQPLFGTETARSISVPLLKAGNVQADKHTTPGWTATHLARMDVFYPLSRSHRRFPKAELRAVYERIVTIFQFLSLETTFHNDPGVSAHCRSLEQIELVVNIFEARNNPQEAVIEIQRVAGDTIVYSRYMRKILAGAFQKNNNLTTNNLCEKSEILFNRADTIIRRLPSMKQDAENPVPGSLEITLHMLLCDRRDARCLGLESLVIMTDPAKTGLSSATNFAKAILTGRLELADGNVLTESRIQERIIYLALLGRWSDTPTDSMDAMADDKPHAELALMALANSVSLLKEASDLNMVLEATLRVTGKSLIPFMQELISRAREEPHAAYLATRVLSAFCRVQPCAVRSCVEPSAIRAAQHIGHRSHAALETETGRLLSAMEVV